MNAVKGSSRCGYRYVRTTDSKLYSTRLQSKCERWECGACGLDYTGWLCECACGEQLSRVGELWDYYWDGENSKWVAAP